MGKSSKGNQPTSSTVTQTTLPAYAEPYVKRVMSGAEGMANRPYEPYSSPRIAPFGQDQLQAFNVARDAPGVGQQQFNAADSMTGIAALGAAGANYNPGAIQNQYQTSTYNPNTFNGGEWDTAAAQQYMSPYMSQVLDSITSRQEDSFSRAQIERDAAAKRAGVFGGYRQGVESAVARGQHELNLGDLISQNLNQGYGNAQQMFASDRGRGLEAMRMGEASGQFGANFGDSSQRAANDYNLSFGQTNEANAQRAAQQQLAQSQGIGAFGQQMGSLGAQRQSTGLAGLDALRGVGLDQQRQTQASLDQGYNDFVNQRDWDKNQLTWLNNIIRGNVTGANSNTVSTESTNPYTQMLGLGVGAVGLANALGQNGSGAS